MKVARKTFLLAVAIRREIDEGWRHLGYIVASYGDLKRDLRPFNAEDVRIYCKGARWGFRKNRDVEAERIPFVALTDVSYLPPIKAAAWWPLKKIKRRRAA